MVPRSELLAAQSEAKARQDELQAKEKELAWLQEQLQRVQEQLSASRQEEAQLRSAMQGMVAKAELEAAKAHSLELEKLARAEALKHRDALAALSERLAALEADKAAALNAMQVLAAARRPRPRALWARQQAGFGSDLGPLLLAWLATDARLTRVRTRTRRRAWWTGRSSWRRLPR